MFLALVASLLLISASAAEPLPLEVASARAGHDERTKQPILQIKLTGISVQALRYLSLNNIGRKAELRVDGKVIVAPVFREPLMDGSFQISGNDFTAESTQALAEELSQPGIKVDVEIVAD